MVMVYARATAANACRTAKNRRKKSGRVGDDAFPAVALGAVERLVGALEAAASI